MTHLTFCKPIGSALLVSALALCFMSPITAVAQGVPNVDRNRLESELRREALSRAEEQEERQRLDRERRQSKRQPDISAVPLTGPQGGPCFTINRIDLKGYERFGYLPKGYYRLLGTCASLSDIIAVLNDINSHYRDLGYITTRAYLPEQDISDGSLEIVIIPGQIEGFVYAGGKQADRRIKAAFPTKRGKLLNLRDLEQGLENINAPRSAKGKFQLIPGEKPGGSFVEVNVEDGRRFHAGLDVKNTGFETTGIAKTTANLGVDNLLGLNDQLSFALTTTPFDDRAEKYADSVSLSLSVPFGNWSWSGESGASRYYFILPGINQSYPVRGRSHYLTLSAERLLMRNQTSKIFAYGGLKLTRTQTFIDGHEIESQRRSLTIGSAGLRGEHAIRAGKLHWDIGAKFGLDAFSAYVFDKSIVDPEFRLIKARVSYQQPLAGTNLRYKGTLVGQYSESILPGTEQFSIGSWSSVRGFHEDTMYGDSGIYLQNSLEWTAMKRPDFELTFSAGLDAGYVEPSKLRSWSQDYLVGASLGAKMKFHEKVSLELRVAHALSRPTRNPPNSMPAFEASRTVGFASLTMEF
ncbi:ShlB/FhaC/HecB family hemolysin secretion/activation protein [Cohaesibacter gelatinilyticus]|uniref:Hemolysin activation/secretion protein n=1 Tax=Cohaesibacter gelatinilyticus TaxID=372072 RepID=A0A285PK26_9HYPH|nr:ShlB/FhaC/HecB family hemolysin secretion/activation protein [Cohaesibacter gelatinilyticus]SNZ20466.1 Hemolysin activation/secretion protein [Cohaesibacter gelatinilyticus]